MVAVSILEAAEQRHAEVDERPDAHGDPEKSARYEARADDAQQRKSQHAAGGDGTSGIEAVQAQYAQKAGQQQKGQTAPAPARKREEASAVWTADGVRAEITYDNIVITYDEGPLVVDLGEMVWYDQDAYRITSDSYSFSITAIDGSYEHNYSFHLTHDGLEMTRYSSSGQEERITLIPD